MGSPVKEGRGWRSGAVAAALVGWLSLGATALAQTNWKVESATVLAGEYNSPPLICTLLPPPYAVLPLPNIPACPALAPFGFCAGGIAVDNDGNFLSGGTGAPALFSSDGNVILM